MHTFFCKMLNLYRDPDGNHIFSVNDPLGKVAPLSTIFVNDAARSDCKECQELKARVKKLEQTITEVFQVHFETTVYYTVERVYFEGVNFLEHLYPRNIPGPPAIYYTVPIAMV